MNPEVQAMHRDLLSKIADVCLATATDKKEYTDVDLLNATLIFQDVFMNKIFDYQQSKNMSEDTSTAEGEEAGRQLRDIIRQFTGIDMHEVAAKQ